MNKHDSVSGWLKQLEAGSRNEAIEQLWERYFERMVRLARNHLRSQPRAAADEEDVALAAFDSFVRAVEEKRFPKLNDHNDLWRVLLTLTKRKAFDHVEQERTAKRGDGTVVQASALANDEGASPDDPLSREPDPHEAAALAEGLQQMLDLLGKADLRQVAVWRMEGYTNEEIAKKLNRSLATAERKVNAIRKIYAAAGLGSE